MAAVETQTSLDFHLSAPQLAFVRSQALYRGFVGGRGAGKSWIGSHDLCMRAKPNCHYIVATPSYTMQKDVTFPMFKKVADVGQPPSKESKGFPGLGMWGGVSGGDRPDVELTNGAVIHFRSADNPDSLLGTNLSGAWLDEASLMVLLAYENLIGCLRENGIQGWLSSTFTARGLTHWTKDVFASGRENSAIFKSHTRENLHNPKGFADILEKQYSPLRARQELAGEFLTVEGAEWPAEWFSGNIWFDEWPTEYACRAIALDPSLGKKKEIGDDSAIAMIQVQRDGYVYVDCDLEVRPTDEIVKRYIDIANRFKPDWAGVETNLYQELLGKQIDDYARKTQSMVRIWGVNNQLEKLVRIRRLTPFLAGSEIRFKRGSPGAEKLVAQLRDFPMGKHDDGPDALEMAIRLVFEQVGASSGDSFSGQRLTDER